MANLFELNFELQEKLEVLRKNEEALSHEELTTKYKVSYEALLGEIKELAKRVLAERLNHVFANKVHAEEVVETFNNAKAVYQKTLFSEYNAEAALDAFNKIFEPLFTKFFVAVSLTA